MTIEEATYQVFNVGTGQPISIGKLAAALTAAMGLSLQPSIVGRFREGDIRHCYADISKIRAMLGYMPKIALEEGLPDLGRWVSGQESTDRVTDAQAELEKRGLLK